MFNKKIGGWSDGVNEFNDDDVHLSISIQHKINNINIFH